VWVQNLQDLSHAGLAAIQPGKKRALQRYATDGGSERVAHVLKQTWRVGKDEVQVWHCYCYVFGFQRCRHAQLDLSESRLARCNPFAVVLHAADVGLPMEIVNVHSLYFCRKRRMRHTACNVLTIDAVILKGGHACSAASTLKDQMLAKWCVRACRKRQAEELWR
jgi:hypothetical protein